MNSRQFDPLTDDIVCSRTAREKAVINIPQKIKFHSPTGMEFGYGGSGPSDLAFNICTQYANSNVEGFMDSVRQVYQDFKWEFIAKMPWEGGTISGAAIREWLRERGVPVPIVMTLTVDEPRSEK